MEADVLSTVQRLARHLRRHPHVCDTCEGIVRWWLADGTPEMVVDAALGWMESRGAVESVHAADGRTRYRRAADRSSETLLAALELDPLSVPARAQPGGGPEAFH
ncbi:MAG TPA: hypothetical protein VGD76_08280 [Ramlibacter sp.]